MIVVVVGCLWLYLCWDVCDCRCGWDVCDCICGGMFVIIVVVGSLWL